MLERLVFLFGLVGFVGMALALIGWSTYRLIHRLKAGDSKAKSFGEWIKNIIQVFFGLG